MWRVVSQHGPQLTLVEFLRAGEGNGWCPPQIASGMYGGPFPPLELRINTA
jgi:hypothetical protein